MGSGGEMIEMAALGRPFNLGMFYDCRADKLVPGITLWDNDDLMQDTRVVSKPHSEFNIVASESISDKSSSMGVEASLKASFLGGLISVEGSAKYLKETKTSTKQARVTLQYKTTTQFKELTMNHLGRGNMKHSYVFDKGIATHVVTAILYGAQAFFVFDRLVSNTENHEHVQGSLRVQVTAIPCLAIEGSGALDLDESVRENVKQFSCTFYGDFCIDQSPTTFDDAIKVYRDLPKRLGPDSENAVPVKVWLLPLTTLDSTAAKLVREISVRLVLEAQTILEDLSDIEMRGNDVLTTAAAQQFPQITQKMKTFMERRRQNLEREAYTLMSIAHLLANTIIVPSENQLYQKTFNSSKIVCFVFSSLGDTDPYLSALGNYLKGDPSDNFRSGSQGIEKEQWYCSKDVCDAVRCKAKLFSDFAETNKDEDIGFFVVGLQDENHKGSTIYIYEDGFRVSDNFEPPSKPHTLTVDNIEHNSVTLSFSVPTFGAETITGYRVEYSVNGAEEWKQSQAEGEEVTITDLSPNTEYSFRVRAVTDVEMYTTIYAFLYDHNKNKLNKYYRLVVH
uniref:Fibronectin type-III domain-containing protein n=1 Tax=Periophthalmus magnuspinnatus TaxID=409849 RepID=A0A3B4ASG3_9GOBI